MALIKRKSGYIETKIKIKTLVTQNLNIYLYKYQKETTIFIYTKQEKINMEFI